MLMMLPAVARADGCSAAKTLTLEQTTVSIAEPLTAGKLTTPYGDANGNLPAFCRVAGVLRPTSDSIIHFEVWLPSTGWNGRLLVVGNGGFAGSVNYGQMAASLRLGYATASTDTGHEGGAEDASWAFRHPEKIVDFGYRALHLTTLRAKSILAAVYGHPAQHAYFDSCSNGGREALMEAQRFPDDYDGILAGAPANNWTTMITAGIDVAQTMIGDPAGYIPAMKLPAINRASLAACDAGDGVKDGVVSDPTHCRFDPAVLLCKGEPALDCLTAPQIRTLNKVYAGGATRDGKPLFPGIVPGAEADWLYWITGTAAGASASYPVNYFRYMVTNDPAWNILNADPAASLQQARQTTSRDLDAIDPDLSRFAAHGGKLIVYHGWNDPAISPWNSIAYVKSVRDKMGAAVDAAVALYMVPGMEHCVGGPGLNSFGQLGLSPAKGAGSGIRDALEGWVEASKVPGPILAAHFTGTGRAAVATTTRPLCPYPQSAKYDGKGDPNLPESFACRID